MGSVRLLVLHGPHLNLLGKGSLAAHASLSRIEQEMERAGSELGVELRSARGDTEAALVEALHRAHNWCTHVLLSPGALAPTAHVLRQALLICAVPYGEVFVEALPDWELHARASVLRERAAVQRTGTAPAVYTEAMRGLVGAAAPTSPIVKPPKEIGRKKSAPAPVVDRAPAAKTIGRRAAKPGVHVDAGLTPEAVRDQIAARLAGKISPGALASWAREHWLALERAPEDGSAGRKKLAEALQALTLSTTAGGQLSEAELLAWMTRLD